MKKLIAILLVAVMCLSLVACGGNNASAGKAIVGEWKDANGNTLIFNNDGTGVDAGGDAFKWRYDSELECYDISTLGFSVTIETDNEIRYIHIVNRTYYFIDDYDKAMEANK